VTGKGRAAVTYHEQMFLKLYYDPVAVSAESAERFFGFFIEALA